MSRRRRPEPPIPQADCRLLEIHYGGKFVDGKHEYEGGSVHPFIIIVEEFGYFKMMGLVAKLGCQPTSTVHWRRKKSVVQVVSDDCIEKMFRCQKSKEDVIPLYVVSGVGPLQIVSPSGKVLGGTKAIDKSVEYCKLKEMDVLHEDDLEYYTTGEVRALKEAGYDLENCTLSGKKVVQIVPSGSESEGVSEGESGDEVSSYDYTSEEEKDNGADNDTMAVDDTGVVNETDAGVEDNGGEEETVGVEEKENVEDLDIEEKLRQERIRKGKVKMCEDDDVNVEDVGRMSESQSDDVPDWLNFIHFDKEGESIVDEWEKVFQDVEDDEATNETVREDEAMKNPIREDEAMKNPVREDEAMKNHARTEATNDSESDDDVEDWMKSCQKHKTKKGSKGADPVVEPESDDDDDFEVQNEDWLEYARKRTDKKIWEVEDVMLSNKSVVLGLGSCFRDAKAFRVVFKAYAAGKGFEYHMKRNEVKKLSVLCKDERCPFWCYASAPKHSNVVEIKTWYPHMPQCPMKLRNKNMSSSFLAIRFFRHIRDEPNMNIDGLKGHILREIGITVHRMKLYRALTKARAIIDGDMAKQYEDMFTYCEMIRNSNVGSVARVEVEHAVYPPDPSMQPMFKRVYICYKAQIDGFLTGCRPLVGLDGCHLKGRFGGQLLAAVGFDGNNGMYPLAFAVVEQENKSSWKWFLEQFFDSYGLDEVRHWVFISDRQKGLVELFNSWLPNAEHRHCMRHMYENWYLKFKSEELTNLFYACSKSRTVERFEERMEQLRNVSEDAHTWLRAKEPRGWCKAFFTNRGKSDIQTNNMSECFNRWILKGRGKPIYELCEYIRSKLMKLFFQRHNKVKQFKEKICPNIQTILESNKEESRNCVAAQSDENRFEVKQGKYTNVVDIKEWTCKCLYWQLNGIPCKHAISTFVYLRHEAEDYVHKYYFVETYKATYSSFLSPVPSMDSWPKVSKYPKLSPPIVHIPPGRPRQRRIKSVAEKLIDPTRASKKGTPMTCSICGHVGHNKRSCSAKDHGESTAQRKQRTAKGKAASAGEKKGTRSGYHRTEEEREAVMELRRKAVAAKLSKGKKKECSPAEIEAKRLAAEAKLRARKHPTEGSADQEQAAKRPKVTPSGASSVPATPPVGPQIGLAQRELNTMRSQTESPFVTVQGQGAARFTEAGRFIRPPAQRGRGRGRGRRGRGRGRAGGRSTLSQDSAFTPPTTFTPTTGSQP